MKTPIITSFVLVLAIVSNVSAKRIPPKEVPEITHEGITYRVLHWKHQNQLQNGGYVEAVREKGSKKEWETLAYLVEYVEKLERDVQDCFITSMKLDKKNERLVVVNENKQTYYIDLKTGRAHHVNRAVLPKK